MSAVALVIKMVEEGFALDMVCKECGTLYYVAPGKSENMSHFCSRHLRLHGKAEFSGRVLDGKRVAATFSVTMELTTDKA